MPTSTIAPQPEFAGILREQETFAVEGDDSVGNQLNSWYDQLMLQSGLGVAPGSILALSLISATAVGGLVFVLQENPLTAAMAAVIGAIAPVLVAMLIRSRRQSQMNLQLPAMIDELARAAKTGRSLENCLTQVANDTPNPLGAEMRNCTRKLSLGLNVEEALLSLPSRTGLVGTSVLATALSVHRQTGGDLIKVLERLARTLRDRQQFQGRLRAATAASRATAILMILLPLVIIAFFTFRDPAYLSTLFASTWGQRITIAAFIFEALGALWVMRILQQSQKI